MNTAPKNLTILSLLIVATLVSGSWPASVLSAVNLDPQGESCPGLDPAGCESDDAFCESEDAGCEGEKACAGSLPESDDCCPSGCDTCYLACCAGIVPLLPHLVIVASSQTMVRFVCRHPGDLSYHCESEIDHPPRA